MRLGGLEGVWRMSGRYLEGVGEVYILELNGFQMVNRECRSHLSLRRLRRPKTKVGIS